MFLKTSIAKGRKYLSLVHAYRQDGKIKHRHIASLGFVDELQKNGQLARLTKKFNELSSVYSLQLDNITEEGRYGL